MKHVNKFEYVLISDSGQMDVFPLGERNFNINYDKEDVNYTKKLSGSITFKDEAFENIMSIERSQNKCKNLTIEIYKKCKEGQNLIFNSRIELNKGSFDLDRCYAEFKFEEENLYFCLEDRKDDEVNLFERIDHSQNITFQNTSGEVETVDISYTSPTFVGRRGYTLREFAERIPTAYQNQGWKVKTWSAVTVLTPSGGLYDVETTYSITLIRKVASIDCMQEVPNYYVLASDNCVNEGTRTYYIPLTPYSFGIKRADEIPDSADSGTYYYEYEAKFFDAEEDSISIDNGMLFNDVLLTMFSDCFSEVRSDFFQLNVPEEERTNINYVTQKESYVDRLLLFQRSDVVRYEENFDNATKANIKLKNLFEWLSTTFNVGYGIVNGVLRIEHEDFFRNVEVIDLTIPEMEKYIHNKRKYKYDSAKFPAVENWIFDLQGSELWNINEINYSDCNVTDKDFKQEFTTEDLTTDVNYLLHKAEESEDDFDFLKGFVLVSAISNKGNDNVVEAGNNSLSWFNLIRDFHFHNRPQKFGRFNENDAEFYTTSLSLIGERFSIPFCFCSNFNVFASYKTRLGIGQVNSAEIGLTSEFLTLELAYPYDVLQEEGTRLRKPMLIPQNFTINLGEELTNILNTSDEDGIVTRVDVRTEPSNGELIIIENNGQFYFQYIGNENYIGTDAFVLVAVDDDGLESEEAGFNIRIIKESVGSGYPILNSDEFNTPYPIFGTEYYVGNVLDNDEANSAGGILTVTDYEQIISRRDEEEAVFRIEPDGKMYVTYNTCPKSFSFKYTAVNDEGFEETQTGRHIFSPVNGRRC